MGELAVALAKVDLFDELAEQKTNYDKSVFMATGSALLDIFRELVHWL